MAVWLKNRLVLSARSKKRIGMLGKEEYKQMITLAKELGMINMGDYILYSMRSVLESHYPAKLLPFQEA